MAEPSTRPISRCPARCTARFSAARSRTPKIKSIDTSAAEAYPGVKAVVTHKDLPALESDEQVGGEVTLDASYLREFLMAKDRVLFHGHPVAAVAATSPHIAEEALDLIKVDYEALPAVVHIEDAIKDDAPVIHQEVRTRGLEGRSDKPTNISVHMELAPWRCCQRLRRGGRRP